MPRPKRTEIAKNKPVGTNLINYTAEFGEDTEKYHNEHPLVYQHPALVVVAGGSGTGKSSFVTNAILGDADGVAMTWDKIHVCAADLSEDLYTGIRKRCRTAIDQAKKQLGVDNIEQVYYEYDSLEKLPEVNTIDKKYQNIFIIDDMVTNKNQKKAEDYFMRVRKRNATVMYLSQAYFKIPLFIRLQAQYTSIFMSPSAGNMSRLSRELIAIEPKQFAKLFNEVKKYPYCPLTIDKRKPNTPLDMQFRAGFHPIGHIISEEKEEDEAPPPLPNLHPDDNIASDDDESE